MAGQGSIAHRSSFHAAKALQGRIARVLWLVVVASLLAAAALQLWTLRLTAQQLQAQAVAEHVRRIGALLEQPGLSAARREALLQAYVDEHRLQRLELTGAQGETLFRRQSVESEPDGAPPAWLVPRPEPSELAWPVRASTAGANAPSIRLRVQPMLAGSTILLWRSSLQFMAALAAVLTCVLVLGLWALRRLRPQVQDLSARPSAFRSELGLSTLSADSTVSTTLAPELAAVPSAKRLRKLARLEGLVVAQAHELDGLRRKAHFDALTGLPARRHTMARLEQALEGDAALPAAGLLLLRVRALSDVNRRVGYENGSLVLQAVADALRAQADCAEEAIAGRINGSDFALLLPFAGVARSTAESLLTKLRHNLQERDPAGGLAIGAVELRGRVDVARAMSLADEALAGAETAEPFAIAEVSNTPDLVAFGDSVWQQRLTVALERRRTVLGGYPVCDRSGQVLYLDCPMRVQFEEGGDYESALRWLAPAARGRLGPDIDLRVVQLALAAIREDGQARCINLAAHSLASTAFMQKVTSELEAAPELARQLWIDVPESVAVDRRPLLAEAVRRWRPLGVRLALEHAGEAIDRIEDLATLGLDGVRIDGRFVRGLTGADTSDMRQFLQGLVRRIHGAGLKISAEGVSLAGDLAVVWALGFDAATGPAVLKRGHSMSPQ